MQMSLRNTATALVIAHLIRLHFMGNTIETPRATCLARMIRAHMATWPGKLAAVKNNSELRFTPEYSWDKYEAICPAA